jgi:hypothetical protein
MIAGQRMAKQNVHNNTWLTALHLNCQSSLLVSPILTSILNDFIRIELPLHFWLRNEDRLSARQYSWTRPHISSCIVFHPDVSHAEQSTGSAVGGIRKEHVACTMNLVSCAIWIDLSLSKLRKMVEMMAENMFYVHQACRDHK